MTAGPGRVRGVLSIPTPSTYIEQVHREYEEQGHILTRGQRATLAVACVARNIGRGALLHRLGLKKGAGLE